MVEFELISLFVGVMEWRNNKKYSHKQTVQTSGKTMAEEDKQNIINRKFIFLSPIEGTDITENENNEFVSKQSSDIRLYSLGRHCRSVIGNLS